MHMSHARVFAVLMGLAISARLAAQGGAAPDPLVRENATVRLAEHTHLIPDEDVGLVPNVGIIVGSRATLVIDPGLGRENGERVLREVAKVSRNTELYVASTHFHAEHTTGYLAFPPTAKYVNARVQEEEFAASGAAQIVTFSQRSSKTAELLKGATQRKADVTLDREYALDLGGVRVRFLVVGPAHTRGDTGFFIEGDGVLFAGDVVMTNSFVAASPQSTVASWLAAFDALAAVKPKIIVPSHGVRGDLSSLETNRATILEIQTRTRALKAAGRTADQAATAVQEELQAKHPSWRRANGVAVVARTVYAE